MNKTLRARIREYVHENDYVSFAELGNRFGQEKFNKGEISITLGDTNIILWSNMDQEASDAINGLLHDQEIFAHPANFMIYLIDGCTIQLPIAKRGGKYKKPHWLPVSLRPVPVEMKKQNTKRQPQKVIGGNDGRPRLHQ